MGSNPQLKKIQALDLKIGLEIKRICELHDISYFIIAGTALGAVRHEGFIPWDDDMDFGMLRGEYERFIEACGTDLGEEFFLQTWDNDPGYPFSYGKMRLDGTHLTEEFSKDAEVCHDGIFVDIFPFDNAPDSEFLRRIQAKKYFFCKRLLWIKKNYGRIMTTGGFCWKAFKYYMFRLAAHFFRYDDVKKYYKRIQGKYNGCKTSRIVADGPYGYHRECIKRQWADQLEPVGFEGQEFFAFKERKDYLTYFYGEYMKLPPEAKRYGHKVIKVDFGKY